jgi:hypothetical protein
MRQMIDNLQKVGAVTHLSLEQVADVFDAMSAAQAEQAAQEQEPDEPPTEDTVETVLHWLGVCDRMVKH